MSKTPRALRRSSGQALLWVTLLLFPLNVYAQGERWQVGTSPSFSSGRYGTDTRTDVFYTPVTARRLFDDGDLTFVIPMTCIRGNGGVIVVNGMPVRQERLDAAGQTGTLTGTTDSTRTGATAAAPTTACGLGDIIVRGRYYVLDDQSCSGIERQLAGDRWRNLPKHHPQPGFRNGILHAIMLQFQQATCPGWYDDF